MRRPWNVGRSWIFLWMYCFIVSFFCFRSGFYRNRDVVCHGMIGASIWNMNVCMVSTFLVFVQARAVMEVKVEVIVQWFQQFKVNFNVSANSNLQQLHSLRSLVGEMFDFFAIPYQSWAVALVWVTLDIQNASVSSVLWMNLQQLHSLRSSVCWKCATLCNCKSKLSCGFGFGYIGSPECKRELNFMSEFATVTQFEPFRVGGGYLEQNDSKQ